jgi:hypothetical protein
MHLHRTLLWSIITAFLFSISQPVWAKPLGALSCIPVLDIGNSPPGTKPYCIAAVFVCGHVADDGSHDCTGGSTSAHVVFEDWDGREGGTNTALATGAVDAFQQAGAPGAHADANGSAIPGSITVHAKNERGGTARAQAGSVVFGTPDPPPDAGNPQSSTQSLSIHLQGNRTVTDLGSPADNAKLNYSVVVYLNKIGQPRWPLSTSTCDPVPANNCVAHVFALTANAFQWSTDETDAFGIPSTGATTSSRGAIIFPQEGKFTLPPGYQPTIVWWAKAVTSGDAVVDAAHTMDLYLDTLSGQEFRAEDGHDYSDPARSPRVRVKSISVPAGNHAVEGDVTTALDPGWKVLGGGVRMEPSSAGKFITAAEHTDLSTAGLGPTNWYASGRDDLVDDLGGMTVFGIELRDGWSDPSTLANPQQLGAAHYYLQQFVGVSPSASSSLSVKSATAKLPLGQGYVMAGGGCQLSAQGSNNTLLTGSYPDSDTSWVCVAQSRQGPAAQITAYILGIKPTLPTVMQPRLLITKATSGPASSPSATAPLAGPGFVITGCGGNVTLKIKNVVQRQFLPGQPLTGIFPVVVPNGDQASACQATSSDHNQSGPGTVTAYAVNLLLAYPTLESIAPGQVQSSVNLTGTHFVDGMVLTILTDPIVPFIPPTIVAQVPISVNSSRQATATLPANVVAGTYKASLGIPNTSGSQQMTPFSVQ